MSGSWLRIGLWLLGSAVLLASVAWWWAVYRLVVGSALITLPSAVPCLVSSSDFCTLVQALCTSSDHLFGIRHYQTFLFWIGAGIITAASLPSLMRPPAARAG